MTDEKIRDVITAYRNFFATNQVDKGEHAHGDYLSSHQKALEHCHGMLDKMERFLREGERNKVHRWIGFIQGVLWSQQIYTLNELKDHNRPDAL